ncbi:MAG: FAD-dependent oxidoreductase, partial [Betaproteobacteria bacterium]
LVIMSIGVRPETSLAKEAGLQLGERGHIVVSEFMQTSDPDIYAAGDAVETADRIMGSKTVVPLGGPANRQGRVAADHILLGAKAKPYPGSIGTAIVRAFEVAAGVTGWTEQRLQKAGVKYGTVTVNDYQHASYFPGATPLTLKILWEEETGRLLGAQATGHNGVDKRIDVLATAISARMDVEDLCHLELSYAPPFGSAKDVVNLAGFAATNLRDGLVANVSSLSQDPDVQRVDVRAKALAEAHPIPGAINIPVPMMRAGLESLDRSKPVETFCSFGKMSYFAARILSQNGFEVASLSGGIKANIDPSMPSKI